jgi:phospholipase C
LTADPERWKRTIMIMIVTYDEGGGQFDHVSPPELETTIADSTSEPFHTLGVRVPALIVSPLVKQGSVFHGLMDHTSILRMIGEKLGEQGKYSPEVNGRPRVGNVTDVLEHPDCRVEQVRIDIPEPPAYSPKDSFVPGQSYRPATPDEQAFAYALNEMREKDRARSEETS